MGQREPQDGCVRSTACDPLRHPLPLSPTAHFGTEIGLAHCAGLGTDPAIRALAARRGKSVGSCFEPFAQEEFRRLACEFEKIASGREPNNPIQPETNDRQPSRRQQKAEIVRSRFRHRGTINDREVAQRRTHPGSGTGCELYAGCVSIARFCGVVRRLLGWWRPRRSSRGFPSSTPFFGQQRTHPHAQARPAQLAQADYSHPPPPPQAATRMLPRMSRRSS